MRHRLQRLVQHRDTAAFSWLGGLVLLASWWAFVLPPSGVILGQQGADWRLEHVEPGSPAARAGARAGALVRYTLPAAADMNAGWTRLIVANSDGEQITITRRGDSPEIYVIGLLMALLAFATRRLAPILARQAAATASIFLLIWPLAPALSPGVGLAVAIVSSLYGVSSLIDEGLPLLRPARLALLCFWLGAVGLSVWLLTFGGDIGWQLSVRLMMVMTAAMPALAALWLYCQFRRTAPPGVADPDRPRQTPELLEIERLMPAIRAARIAAVEAERTRIASELHAAILPDLRGIAVALRSSGRPSQAAAGEIEDLERSLRDVVSATNLPLIDTHGLISALEWLAEHTERHHAVEVRLDLALDGFRPPGEVERAIWRITQQAVDNAIRHGNPSCIVLSVLVQGEACEVTIADDGSGISQDAAERAGYGLTDMRQRAALIGATLSIKPRSDGGTEVHVRWSA